MQSAKRWKKRARLPDVLCAQIETALAAQNELERARCASVDAAAQPFGELLRDVFVYGLEDAYTARIAAEFGLHIGRYIYYLDAVDDYEKDKRKGRYNPFLCAGENPRENPHLRDAARLELQGAAQALSLLQSEQHSAQAVLENIVYDGLTRCFDNLLHTPACPDGEQKQERQEPT